MYPPSGVRAESPTSSGAVVGAILGPAVFSPIFSGKDKLEAGVLTIPWLGAGVLSLVALVLALNVRPDPKRIAELIAPPVEALLSLPRRCARSSAVRE